MIHYLELRHVVALHDALIEKYGGIHGLRDQGLLESAIAQPAQKVFGYEPYSDVPSKAAAYAFFISESQPFLDGNKRTACATTLTFLRLNGYDLIHDLATANKAVYDVIMDVANKQMTREALAAWFKKNTRQKRKRGRPLVPGTAVSG